MHQIAALVLEAAALVGRNTLQYSPESGNTQPTVPASQLPVVLKLRPQEPLLEQLLFLESTQQMDHPQANNLSHCCFESLPPCWPAWAWAWA